MIRPKHPASRTLGPPLVRCREYLAFVRRQACLLCDRDGVDAHHYGPHGLGVKAPDWLAVPLCRWHHEDVHQRKGDAAHLLDMTEAELDQFVAVAQRDMLVAWLMEQEPVERAGF